MIPTYVTYILLSLAETYILHRLLVAFLERNQIAKGYYRQGLAAYFCFQMLTYAMGAPLFSTAVLYFLCTMAIAILFFGDTLQMKAYASSIFVVLNYACKVLSVTLLMRIGNLAMPDLPHELVLDGAAQIAACLLFLSCVFIIICFRNLRLRNLRVPYTLIAYIVPCGTLYIVMRMFMHSHLRAQWLIYLDASGLLFCTALALFYLLDKSVVIDEASEQQLVTMQLLTTQEKYYKHLEQFQREMQSIRHDIKNHMRCAITMLEQGHHDEATEYLRGLYDNAARPQSPVHCGNRVVDIALNHSLSSTQALGIQCRPAVLLPPELPPIDNLDLCTVFTNLLDNAVEACSRITDPEAERFIDISAGIRKGYLFIRISNSYNGEIHQKNNIYETVKTGVRFSGIGISNVRRVVERYNGEVTFKHDEKVFTVVAMLAVDC